jgi:hypothetical protein
MATKPPFTFCFYAYFSVTAWIRTVDTFNLGVMEVCIYRRYLSRRLQFVELPSCGEIKSQRWKPGLSAKECIFLL